MRVRTVSFLVLPLIFYVSPIVAKRRHKRPRVSAKIKQTKRNDIDLSLSQINSLKQKLFKAKSSLVISSFSKDFKVPLIPQIKLTLKNKLSNFVINGLSVSIDSDELISVYGNLDADKLDTSYETVEGKHTVYVRAVLKGRGTGIFNYLANYTVVRELKQTIDIPQRGKYILTINLEELSAFLHTFEERPTITVQLERIKGI